MSYELIYMPSHAEHNENDCWCRVRGFKTKREAAIYAYDNCRCNICKSHEKVLHMNDVEFASYISDIATKYGTELAEETIEFVKMEKEEVDLNDKEDLWYFCSCSAEWWICEEDDIDS